jgi:hypothetical protein
VGGHPAVGGEGAVSVAGGDVGEQVTEGARLVEHVEVQAAAAIKDVEQRAAPQRHVVPVPGSHVEPLSQHALRHGHAERAVSLPLPRAVVRGGALASAQHGHICRRGGLEVCVCGGISTCLLFERPRADVECGEAVRHSSIG